MTLSITIDLDPLSCYRQIFGLQPEDTRLDPAVLTGTARFCELLAELGCPGTLFVVGESTSAPEVRSRLAAAASAGHELANHTWSHPYDLTRLDEAEIDEQVRLGAEAIAAIAGRAPAGFRAPGYLLGDRVLASLERQGVLYDSSALPSPTYQAVKLTAMGALKIMGRPSASLVGNPAEALGPAAPYRPDARRPWRRGSAGLVELPISVALGLPLTGGVLALTGRTGAALLARAVRTRSFINLEFHGVDFLDLKTDGLDPALAAQGDLKIPVDKKLSTYRAFLQRVMANHEVKTLAQVARDLPRS